MHSTTRPRFAYLCTPHASRGERIEIKMHETQGLVNHVVLVLDGTASMIRHRATVVQVANQLIKDLAISSEAKNQETRVSVYLFGEDTVACLIFDMDVMRLPEFDNLYHVLYENTSLFDALMISQHDLSTTSTLYGEHGFLTYVITDGVENASRQFEQSDVEFYLKTGNLRQGSGWHNRAGRDLHPARVENSTVAWIVPDEQGVRKVTSWGAPKGNVIKWNTHDTSALVGVGAQIATATDAYMDLRASGVHVSRSVFSVGDDAINTATVQAAALSPLDPSTFRIIENNTSVRAEMADLVRVNGMSYVNGTCYYQYWKTENVQPQKNIIIRRRSTGEVFTDPSHGSPAVRAMIGLGTDHTEKVKPGANSEYEVFIQSTASNRKIIPGRTALIMNPHPLAGALRSPASATV